MTSWEIKAKEFANCNCAYGCPCQFNALPTHGHCEASVAFEIEEGHYGDVKLDGLRMGGVYQWPGAVHEGRGKCQPFVDERADDKQREALLKIMAPREAEAWMKTPNPDLHGIPPREVTLEGFEAAVEKVVARGANQKRTSRR